MRKGIRQAPQPIGLGDDFPVRLDHQLLQQLLTPVQRALYRSESLDRARPVLILAAILVVAVIALKIFQSALRDDLSFPRRGDSRSDTLSDMFAELLGLVRDAAAIPFPCLAFS